ncbi:hypothetical protein MATL_G00000670 [Megalops atlanticus]|uniref:BAH domain-containing protein n=1 Tax=Megalops atlanticus TaxID=7932 RepID=A0A9D3QGF7_MEGAT|nr:hypothetical protein MATL_G00000670 [Megalops atlanticus]
MELLSELADLELQQQRESSGSSQGEDVLTFDLRSLATLATARSLELGCLPEERMGALQRCPARRTLNLRRKCSWAPRHEPVCPVKGAMETMDGQELAMRVQLAELQRRYKEKQRELAKLQRKHEHQKQEPCRSPARRGPGRPRKRKSGPSVGPVTPSEAPKRVKSLGAGLGLLFDDLRGGGEVRRAEKKLSNRSYDRLSATQMKARCCKKPGRPVVLSSELGRKVSQLKQKAKAKRGPPVAGGFRRRDGAGSGPAPQRLGRAAGPLKGEGKRPGDSGAPNSTAGSAGRGGAGDGQDGWAGRVLAMRRSRTRPQTRARGLRMGSAAAGTQEAGEEKDASPSESEPAQRGDEEEGRQDSEKEHDNIKAPPSKDSDVIGPSPSSVVKLEANQKAKNKKERQGLLGSLNRSAVEEVKVRKRAPFRLATVTAEKRHPERQEFGVAKRARPQGMEPAVLHPSSERLKKATCKSTAPQRPMGKPRGRAVSRLLESFAANEGFQLDEDSSFSEGEEDDLNAPGHPPHPSKGAPPAVPNCVLTKEALVDGLKVLISKEDELLYTAYVHTLDLPDIYSVVIEGERGNRPRIYSLEQLLKEAVLDVRPESEAVLAEGTRVCAYWSERSRCLYPGYVRRGGPGEEGKEGSVMVEFDDGDRGWISLHSIRLLPPGYQVHCADATPALHVSSVRRRRKNAAVDKTALSNLSCERQGDVAKTKPGVPKSISSGRRSPVAESTNRSCTPLLSWPAVAVPRKRTPHNFFPLNGAPRRMLKGKEAELFPLLSSCSAVPANGIFGSPFEVDSFSSIANGYASLGSRQAAAPLGPRAAPCGRGRKPGDGGRKAGGVEFPVKLDHEGVTAPKTKSSKALLQLGGQGQGGTEDKGFGAKGVGGVASPPSPALALGEYADFGMNCHSDCHSFYSDLDEEEEEEEEEERRAALAAAATSGRFLSRLSVSSSSSGSSSSSSSGSLSSSSLCSSENDSSYSSEDEESSTLLLQGCLSSHHALLQPPEPPPAAVPRSFVAKAVAVSPAKAGAGGRPLRRRESPNSTPAKPAKDPARKQRLPAADSLHKMAPFLPVRQLWRWSGNPTQRRGMKGKARKLFYKAIVRGRDTVHVGDCAVFLSSGRPHLPYVGRIESFWESWASNMVVKVKWFYHPEETKLGKRHRDGKHALYQSCHEDENDVQTISHRCQVVSRAEYERLSRGRRPVGGCQDLFYLAGTYDPTTGQLVTAEGVSILC